MSDDESAPGLLLALAGLPGTGKSTLARALAAELGAPVFDKDRVREALFGASGVEYSSEQDDHCCEVCYSTATWMLQRREVSIVLLDGRTYTRAAHVQRLSDVARAARVALTWVECTCPPEIARERLARDASCATHPAANRGPELHDAVAARAEALQTARLVIDTHELALDAQVERCRDYLRANQA